MCFLARAASQCLNLREMFLKRFSPEFRGTKIFPYTEVDIGVQTSSIYF